MSNPKLFLAGALPDGRTIAGSGKSSAPDRKLFDVGGANDSRFAVAPSPAGTRGPVAGYPGGDTSGRETDDGTLMWLHP